MKKNFTFSIILASVLSITLFSCAKENLRGGGGWNTVGGVGGVGGYNPNACTNIINSNFNGTPIPAGRNVWFNAHLKCAGNISSGTIIYITGGMVTMPGQPVLNVPDAQITIDASITTPSYTWDGNSWDILIPMSDARNNIFFSGVILNSPGLPGGLNPVDFTATFTANRPGVNLDWQWSAACFNTTMDYNALNLSVVDGPGTHAGVPNGYNGHAVGGARGGGAADLTGSWSATGHVVTCVGSFGVHSPD